MSEPVAFTLRKATDEDLAFLRTLSKAEFDPTLIDVIQYEGKDVGRLRIVRSPEYVYIGGIQILPEFQNKGIGTALFSELKEESKKTGVPIILEVHDENAAAMSFYKELGFEETGKTGKKTILKFLSKN